MTRASIVFTGFGIIFFGLLPWIGIGYPIEIIGTIGLLNILFGIITPKSPGLDLQPEQSGPLKLIVERPAPGQALTNSYSQTANS